MAKNTGEGRRKGSVAGRTRIKNPAIGSCVRRDEPDARRKKS